MSASLPTPLVTVVVLCHNHAPFVRQALDSVREQDYTAIQLLVIDDGSTDSSHAEIQEWQRIHQKAEEVLYLKESMGMTRAFMQVEHLIKGEYLIDLAADDWLAATRISEQVAALEANPDAGVCFTDAVLVAEDELELGLWWQLGKDKLLNACGQDWVVNLLAHNPICTPTLIYRTSAWRAVGGFDTQLAYEDLDVLLKLALAGSGFLHLNRPLTYRRMVTTSATNRQYSIGTNEVLRSTATILNRLVLSIGAEMSNERKGALRHFLDYHIWLAFRAGDEEAAFALADVYTLAGLKPSLTSSLFITLTHPNLARALGHLWPRIARWRGVRRVY